jgi:uncharacterized damage-inducible protein DinB
MGRREDVLDILDRLLAHDAWTTRQLLLRCRELDATALHEPFDLGHQTLSETLDHMIGNVRTWTDLMSGASIPRDETAHPERSVVELIAWHETASADFAALARRIRDEGRLDELWIDVLDDPPAAKSYGGAIAHVITHNMHHRAEVLHMLQRLGIQELPEGDVLSWEATETAS